MTWRPSRVQGALEVLGAAVLLAVALSAPGLGRVLAVPVALALVALGLRDLLLVPTLEADAHGLVVAGGLTKQAYPWSQVIRTRVITDRRTPLLELDLEHALVVLSRRRLGAPPYLVLEQLDEIRSGQRS